jgi:hypothetical protein
MYLRANDPFVEEDNGSFRENPTYQVQLRVGWEVIDTYPHVRQGGEGEGGGGVEVVHELDIRYDKIEVLVDHRYRSQQAFHTQKDVERRDIEHQGVGVQLESVFDDPSSIGPVEPAGNSVDTSYFQKGLIRASSVALPLLDFELVELV